PSNLGRLVPNVSGGVVESGQETAEGIKSADVQYLECKRIVNRPRVDDETKGDSVRQTQSAIGNAIASGRSKAGYGEAATRNRDWIGPSHASAGAHNLPGVYPAVRTLSREVRSHEIVKRIIEECGSCGQNPAAHDGGAHKRVHKRCDGSRRGWAAPN